jgi:hypothetical protein
MLVLPRRKGAMFSNTVKPKGFKLQFVAPIQPSGFNHILAISIAVHNHEDAKTTSKRLD